MAISKGKTTLKRNILDMEKRYDDYMEKGMIKMAESLKTRIEKLKEQL